MRIEAWPTPEDFLAHLGKIDEVAGCIVHGLVHTWLARPKAFRAGTPLLTASLGEQVLAAAVQAGIGKLVFSLGPTEAILALAAWFKDARPNAAVAPDSARAALLRLWPGRATLESTLYRLDEAPSAPSAPGLLRPARRDEAAWLTDWTADFYKEARLPDEPKPQLVVEAKLKAAHLFVWEDRVPRAIAALAGPTPRSVRINNVYTPEGFRGRGYGSAAVAALAAMQLENGKELVTLFADRGRAHTNRMYRRIGFQPVADFVDLAIEPV